MKNVRSSASKNACLNQTVPTSPCPRRRPGNKSSSSFCNNSKKKLPHSTGTSLKRRQDIYAVSNVEPMSTRGAMSRCFKPLRKANAWTSHTLPPMRDTPVMHYGRRGGKVTCAQCGLNLHLDGQQRLILTSEIKKPCKGSGISGSPPLTEIFRKQAEQASQQKSAGDSTSDTSHTTQQAPPALQEKSKKPRLQHQQPAEHHEPYLKGQNPTPRRLHFPTELDQQAQGTTATRQRRP